MKPTERYLKHATRGLWGRARRELRAELSGHLNERVAELRLGNLSVDEAERQTLRELGAPEQVSVGMLGVHTVPAVGKTGVVGLLMATVLFSALPQGLAQVKGIYSYSKNNGFSGYLDFEQLKATIEKAGGKVTGPPNNAKISLPGLPFETPQLDTYWWTGGPMIQDGRVYVPTDSLIIGFQSSGADLRLSGWKNPTLHVGSAKIQVQTDDLRVINELYRVSLMFSAGLTDSDPFGSLEPNGITEVTTLSGLINSGRIYALLTPKFRDWYTLDSDGHRGSSGNINLITDINQAQADKVQFRIDKDTSNFKFVSSVAEFNKALEPYRNQKKTNQWNAKHPAPALVLELSGHFGADAFKVVSPKAIKLR